MSEEKRKQCPCEFDEIEPCCACCSCRNKFMSAGCNRCCLYGSYEQQLASAKRLVQLEMERNVWKRLNNLNGLGFGDGRPDSRLMTVIAAVEKEMESNNIEIASRLLDEYEHDEETSDGEE